MRATGELDNLLDDALLVRVSTPEARLAFYQALMAIPDIASREEKNLADAFRQVMRGRERPPSFQPGVITVPWLPIFAEPGMVPDSRGFWQADRLQFLLDIEDKGCFTVSVVRPDNAAAISQNVGADFGAELDGERVAVWVGLADSSCSEADREALITAVDHWATQGPRLRDRDAEAIAIRDRGFVGASSLGGAKNVVFRFVCDLASQTQAVFHALLANLATLSETVVPLDSILVGTEAHAEG